VCIRKIYIHCPSVCVAIFFTYIWTIFPSFANKGMFHLCPIRILEWNFILGIPLMWDLIFMKLLVPIANEANLLEMKNHETLKQILQWISKHTEVQVDTVTKPLSAWNFKRQRKVIASHTIALLCNKRKCTISLQQKIHRRTNDKYIQRLYVNFNMSGGCVFDPKFLQRK